MSFLPYVTPSFTQDVQSHIYIWYGGNEQEGKKKFKAYPIGFFHIDIAEVRTDEGKLYLFVAVELYTGPVLSEETYGWSLIHKAYYEMGLAELLEKLIEHSRCEGKAAHVRFYQAKLSVCPGERQRFPRGASLLIDKHSRPGYIIHSYEV